MWAILEHVELDGTILDFCGAETDMVSTMLTAHGLRVATDDFNVGYVSVSPALVLLCMAG